MSIENNIGVIGKNSENQEKINKQEKKFSKERKRLQKENLLPKHFITAGLQVLINKGYLSGEEIKNPSIRYKTIAETLAKHVEGKLPLLDNENNEQSWFDAFYNLLWDGIVSPSSPMFSNTGTNKGLPVSCSGGYVGDSIENFYDSLKENALLTKHGFGTSGYFGNIRGRGEKFGVNGECSGVVPVIDNFFDMSNKISQGGTRKGAYAAYVDLMCPDFDELILYMRKQDDGKNIGFCIYDEDIEKFEKNDKEVCRRINQVVSLGYDIGKGYFHKTSLANRLLPDFYKKAGLKVFASNLCTEINLPANSDLTFTCVLLSINASKWDIIKSSKNMIKKATIMLDCVVSEFLEKAKDMAGLEKAVKFTEMSRAIGVGVCGFHSYLISKKIPFESLEASYFNVELFKTLEQETLEASRYMAKHLGECELTKGSGQRNASLRAVAPTKTTALLMGGISEGINPYPAVIYEQNTPAGTVFRIIPELIQLMKEKNIYNNENIQKIIENGGSVQGLDNLFTKEEQKVFKGGFEINQRVVIRMAEQRQKHLDQLQSLNLFCAGSGKKHLEEVNYLHNMILKSKYLVTRYYIHGLRDKGNHYQQLQEGCSSCQ